MLNALDTPFTAPSGCLVSITEAGRPTADMQLLSFAPGNVRLSERAGTWWPNHDTYMRYVPGIQAALRDVRTWRMNFETV